MFPYANGLPMQVPNIEHRPKEDEYILKALILRAPVNHRARHWGTFTTILSIYEEFQPGIIEKRNRSGSAEHIILPMTSIRGDRYKGKHLSTIL